MRSSRRGTREIFDHEPEILKVALALGWTVRERLDDVAGVVLERGPAEVFVTAAGPAKLDGPRRETLLHFHASGRRRPLTPRSWYTGAFVWRFSGSAPIDDGDLVAAFSLSYELTPEVEKTIVDAMRYAWSGVAYDAIEAAGGELHRDDVAEYVADHMSLSGRAGAVWTELAARDRDRLYKLAFPCETYVV